MRFGSLLTVAAVLLVSQPWRRATSHLCCMGGPCMLSGRSSHREYLPPDEAGPEAASSYMWLEVVLGKRQSAKACDAAAGYGGAAQRVARERG